MAYIDTHRLCMGRRLPLDDLYHHVLNVTLIIHRLGYHTLCPDFWTAAITSSMPRAIGGCGVISSLLCNTAKQSCFSHTANSSLQGISTTSESRSQGFVESRDFMISFKPSNEVDRNPIAEGIKVWPGFCCSCQR